jgi:hypothetical protein
MPYGAQPRRFVSTWSYGTATGGQGEAGTAAFHLLICTVRHAQSTISCIFSLLSSLHSLLRGLLRFAIARVVDKMSFGIGIGDFIQVVEIANKVSSPDLHVTRTDAFSLLVTQAPPCF